MFNFLSKIKTMLVKHLKKIRHSNLVILYEFNVGVTLQYLILLAQLLLNIRVLSNLGI